VDTKDYENGGVAAKDNFNAAVSGASPGSKSFIVLAHDIQSFTANGFVQWMLDEGKSKGFQFVTVGECLGDAPGNWYRDPTTGNAVGGGSGSTPSSSSKISSATPTPTSSSSSKPVTTSAPTTSTKATTTVAPTNSIDGGDNAAKSPTPTPTPTTRPSGAAVQGVAGSSLLVSLLGAVAWLLM
jgi:cell division septation protein DedD